MENKKSKPNGVEVIRIRLFKSEQQDVVKKMFSEISEGIKRDSDGAARAALFGSARVDTDWTIHLYNHFNGQKFNKTMTGIHFAEALSAVGLVQHSVWYCC